MRTCSLSDLSDFILLRDFEAMLARERGATADVLTHLAEVDARRLYLPAGYPSMYLYCVQGFHMSEDSACRRIRAARTAREFPAVLAALADGQLHLAAVVMLAPHLTTENVDELVAGAVHKTKAEIEQLLARRFPRPDMPTRIELLESPQAPTGSATEGGREPVDSGNQSAPARIDSPAPRPRMMPLAPERFALQVTIGQGTHDKLRYAQALMGHQLPAGEIAQVLDRALDELILLLERRKFAATARPRSGRSSARRRHIPARVRRAVWERDQGQCTFVSEAGRRCPARSQLEFDHVEAVARGGESSVSGIRLRCRAHNQYEAERTFGAQFMNDKRRAAQLAAAEKRQAAIGARVGAARVAAAEADTPARACAVEEPGPANVRIAAAEPDPERDVTPWLRALGFSSAEAHRAATACDAIPEASLEARVRFSLSLLRPPHRRLGVNGMPAR